MKNIFKIFFFTTISLNIHAQSIDRVEAVIGDEIILTSDIESQYLQYLSQGNIDSEQVKCEIIEDILFQKLLICQAKIDSVEVSNDEIETEISKRLNYFENQLGSFEKVEEYFGKTKVEIELELSKVIKDQFLAQKVQSSISSDIKVTPLEVKDFFNTQNLSDIPFVPTKVEVSQLIIKPKISNEEKDKLRSQLNSYRERVYNGEDFKMLAILYSDDLGSATNGGELGFVNRGDLVPEFERAAFRLKSGEISEVVETQFGFHIIQLIERRGEQINVRHILLKNKVSSTALYNSKLKIEDIANQIKLSEITFDEAIAKYSDDDSKNNGGLLLNPNTMTSTHTLDEMNSSLKYAVENLNINEISSPLSMTMSDGTKAYRILRLNNRIESHKANLQDDFSMIKDFVINIKKQEKIMLWIKNTIKNTYININDDLLSCSFKNKWVK